MQYSSRAVVYTDAWADIMLDAIEAENAGPLLETPKVRLSIDPAFNPTPFSTRAELAGNEADFTGYTAGGYTPTFTASVNLAEYIRGLAAVVVATAGTADPFVDNIVTGWWLDNGTVVLCGERFAGGQTFAFGEQGDFLVLQIALPFNLLQAASLPGE